MLYNRAFKNHIITVYVREYEVGGWVHLQQHTDEESLHGIFLLSHMGSREQTCISPSLYGKHLYLLSLLSSLNRFIPPILHKFWPGAREIVQWLKALSAFPGLCLIASTHTAAYNHLTLTPRDPTPSFDLHGHLHIHGIKTTFIHIN